MNGRGWRTAEALPRIILRLRKKGYKLVTVSELFGLPPAPATIDPAR
jgi:peptidoglycan/xylan/chitin deacetylase (PgdA/CDA1 family)